MMAILIQRKRIPEIVGYAVPVNGIILWHGLASMLPEGFSIDSFAYNVFVRGANVGGSSNTPIGSASHSHSNPTPTNTVADHRHAIDGGDTSDSYSTENIASIGGAEVAGQHDHAIAYSSGEKCSWAGSHNHVVYSTNTTQAYPPYRREYWIKNISEEEIPLPIGGILMFDGLLANRPAGCELCDGSVGTIDLREKFIYGASNDSEVGNEGGSSTHSHSNPATQGGGSHTHNLTPVIGQSNSYDVATGVTGVSVAEGSHSHTASFASDLDASHTHTIPATSIESSLPLYLKLYFVMRPVV